MVCNIRQIFYPGRYVYNTSVQFKISEQEVILCPIVGFKAQQKDPTFACHCESRALSRAYSIAERHLAGASVGGQRMHGDEILQHAHESEPVRSEAGQMHYTLEHGPQERRPTAEGLVKGVQPLLREGVPRVVHCDYLHMRAQYQLTVHKHLLPDSLQRGLKASVVLLRFLILFCVPYIL